MKRFLIVSSILTGLLLVGGAGYKGFLDAQPVAESVPVAPVTVGVTEGSVQHTVTAPGQLVGTHESLLGFKIDGRLTELNIRPGTIVQAGDVLARIDAQPFETQLSSARLQLQLARDAYERQIAAAELAAETGAARVDGARGRVPSLTTAEVILQEAIAAEQRAQTEYDKALDRPWEEDSVRESYRLELAALTANRQIAEAELAAVRSQQWAASQEIQALRTEVEQANLNADFMRETGVDPLLVLAVEQAEADLAATVLTAPFSGVVLDVTARLGETAAPHNPFILLSDPTQAEVRTTIIEEDLPLVQIGQTAELYFDAQPDIAVEGAVDRVVPQRVAGEERPLYHVYIRIANDLPPSVYPGMTADAAVIIDGRNNVLRLPRALVPTRADGSAVVEVWENGRIQTYDVQTGLRGDVYTEIIDGLRSGLQIVAE